jgi:signal transduction histidine kinase
MTTGADGRVSAPASGTGDARRDHDILLAVALTARLFRAGDLEAELATTLAALGRAAGVTRAFLFDIVRAPAGPSAALTHEWTAPGIASLLGSPLLGSFVGGAETDPMAVELDAGRAFVLRAADATDRLRTLLEAIGSRTVLIVPVEVNGERTASIGFEDAIVDRTWDDDEVAALMAAAGMIGAAIGARRTAESLRNRDAILEAVADAGERFMRGEPVHAAIDATIARLGEATHSSRVVLVERRRSADATDRMLARHAWAASGVRPLAAGPDSEGFGYFPRWARELAGARIIAGNVADFPADERELLERDRVRSIVIAPVAVGGRWWGHLGFDDSVTERAWSALEIDALRTAAGMIGAALQQTATTEAIAAAHARLRDVQRMDAVGRLAGGLAHDFNNVLTVVAGHARFLLDGAPSDEARADAQSILDAAQSGTELTRQLMAFSRKRIEQLAPVDLGELVERSRRMFERLVGPSVAVELALTPRLPAVMTDAAQFEHVLVNLVSNARDAMPDGGTLTISTGPAPDAQFVELVVRDSGIGMDEATQAHIFEPLFTTKPSGRGTGFGLATTAAVVAGSGGRIAVTSAPGAGATFTIRLPVADGPADDPEIGLEVGPENTAE